MVDSNKKKNRTMEFYTNKALDKNKRKQYKRSELQNYNVSRSNTTVSSGMSLEMRIQSDGKKKYFIKAIEEGSVWWRMNSKFKIPLLIGDRIIEINGVECEDFPGLYQMNDLLKKEAKITVSLLKEEKQKKWLHDKPMQYPGKLPETEDVFRPEHKVYPPSKAQGVSKPAQASTPKKKFLWGAKTQNSSTAR